MRCAAEHALGVSFERYAYLEQDSLTQSGAA